MEKQITYGNFTITNFISGCSKSPGASTDLPGRQVRSQVRLVAPGAPPDARFVGKSLVLLNNLKHCYQTKIEPIVQSSIRLFKINMHPLYIWLLTLFLIYLIVFLIKTPLIHLINIIIIKFFLNVLDIAYICYIKTTNTGSSVL